MATQTITPKELFSKLQQGEKAYLLDVRTQPEYDEVHAEGVNLTPLDELKPDSLKGLGQNIYIFCRSGGRATKAALKLEEAGIANVTVVEGGTTLWESAGLPVIKGTPKVISLMRQVQIAVGTFTLAGALLALLVNPYFVVIPLITGAGLIFAGVTNTCGMALILAKMPWNKSSCGCGGSGKSCSS